MGLLLNNKRKRKMKRNKKVQGKKRKKDRERERLKKTNLFISLSSGKDFFKVTFFFGDHFFFSSNNFFVILSSFKTRDNRIFYKGFIPAIVAASTAASTTVGYTCYQEGKSWSDHNSLVTTAGKSHVTARAF